jgi:hypothetical protein
MRLPRWGRHVHDALSALFMTLLAGRACLCGSCAVGARSSALQCGDPCNAGERRVFLLHGFSGAALRPLGWRSDSHSGDTPAAVRGALSVRNRGTARPQQCPSRSVDADRCRQAHHILGVPWSGRLKPRCWLTSSCSRAAPVCRPRSLPAPPAWHPRETGRRGPLSAPYRRTTTMPSRKLLASSGHGAVAPSRSQRDVSRVSGRLSGPSVP